MEMLSLEAVFDDAPAPVHPYNETFESAEFDPVIIMHTSGSTGIPKPIYCNQGLFCSTDNYHNFLEYQGLKFVIDAMATCSRNTYCPCMHIHAQLSLFIRSRFSQCLYSMLLDCTPLLTSPHSGANP